ncbi:MAG: pentapeptide repeat-containing protein [SAR324 cluster bacterium]|nr:pentapeptide repeat-containing protein [SAR324 cluster bacterium]
MKANSDLAAQAWEVVKDSTNPKILEEYIRMFPTAPQRNLAKLKLMTLESPPPVQSTEGQVTVQVLFGEAAKQKLFRDNECVGCDLNGTSLSGNILRGANLKKASLRGADLRGTDLHEAKLREADLRGADLQRADLRGADLSNAEMRYADLNKANIKGASLINTKFCNTTMPDGSIANRDCYLAQQEITQSNKTPSGEAAKKKLLETKECVGCDL